MRTCPALACVVVLLVGAASAAPAQDAGQITIYRCTDAQGRLTLRDSPCRKGETQSTVEMLRPQDPPPGREPPATVEPTDTPPPTVQREVVYRAPPRPMYECVRPDGTRYASETPEGDPRWVPWWTLGYPVVIPRNPLGDRVGAPPARPGDPPIAVVHGAPGGTWVRDRCYRLPQAEVCARLDDRLAEINRRFIAAMPSERDVLRDERRALEARRDNDCR
ncbi:hypothetical protein GCM10028862_20600 [Luteimonas pelagia]